MKPNNAQLVHQLTEVTRNLRFSSESDDRFEPFIWEIDEQGTLTLEKLLQSEGFLFPLKANILLKFVSSETSWSSWSTSRPSEVAIKMSLKYTELIDFLNSHLKTLEIYLVSNLGEGDSGIRREEVKKI